MHNIEVISPLNCLFLILTYDESAPSLQLLEIFIIFIANKTWKSFFFSVYEDLGLQLDHEQITRDLAKKPKVEIKIETDF